MTEDSVGLTKMTQKWRPAPHLQAVTPRQSHEHLLCKTKSSWQDWKSTQVQKCQITLLFATIRYTRLYIHCPLLFPENPDLAPNPGQDTAGHLGLNSLSRKQQHAKVLFSPRSTWSWIALASRMTKTGRGRSLIFIAKEQHFVLRGQSHITSVNSKCIYT